MKSSKNILSVVIGSSLEWYDYVIYGYFAEVVGSLFFPSLNPVNQTLAGLSVFAFGFISRPIGAVLFGYIGDRVSKKSALSGSIIMMALPTLAIGCLPTYSQIGVWAPILLLLMRFIQGVSLGGEFGACVVYLMDCCPAKKRGFYGSLIILSLACGVLLGAVVSYCVRATFGEVGVKDFWWRLPFLLSFLIAIFGFYIRKNLSNTKSSTKGNRTTNNPFTTLFTKHYKTLLKAMLIYLAITVPFYSLAVFLRTALQSSLGYTNLQTTTLNISMMLAMGGLAPLFGLLADKISPRKTMFFGCLSLIIFCFIPLSVLLNFGLSSLTIIAICGAFLGGLMSFVQAGFPAVLYQMFATEVKSCGVSLSSNLCAILFGATSPIVLMFLTKLNFNLTTVICFYVVFFTAISLVTLAHGEKSD